MVVRDFKLVAADVEAGVCGEFEAAREESFAVFGFGGIAAVFVVQVFVDESHGRERARRSDSVSFYKLEQITLELGAERPPVAVGEMIAAIYEANSQTNKQSGIVLVCLTCGRR